MACLKFRTDLRVYIVIQTGAIALKILLSIQFEFNWDNYSNGYCFIF